MQHVGYPVERGGVSRNDKAGFFGVICQYFLFDVTKEHIAPLAPISGLIKNRDVSVL